MFACVCAHARYLSDHWTVEAMAEMAEYHPTWFASVYKKRSSGISPLNDLLDARMKHAEELLRSHPLTIHQIATQCGFTSQEDISRECIGLKRKWDNPPGQSRKAGASNIENRMDQEIEADLVLPSCQSPTIILTLSRTTQRRETRAKYWNFYELTKLFSWSRFRL